jgi:hypothetical protein
MGTELGSIEYEICAFTLRVKSAVAKTATEVLNEGISKVEKGLKLSMKIN